MIPIFPTSGYPTFRFNRRALSERSVLTLKLASSEVSHPLSHHVTSTFYVLSFLLFRRWRALAKKKRKKAQKQMPITRFLGK
jgi:hypothetical protein